MNPGILKKRRTSNRDNAKIFISLEMYATATFLSNVIKAKDGCYTNLSFEEIHYTGIFSEIWCRKSERLI